MAKNSGVGKLLLVLGALLGILSIILYFIEESFGAWWRIEGIGTSYMSAFGTYSTGEDLLDSILGFYGILGPILFIIGAICVFIPLIKKNKAYGFLGSFLMIGGMVIFLIGLGNIEDYESILSGIGFLTSSEYNVFFGEFGFWSWGLSIGFFIGAIAIFFSIIGSVLYD